MLRKIIIYVTLMCFIVCVQGCTSRYTIPAEELQREVEHKNVTIKTIDGAIYEFDNVHIYEDYIEGYVDDTILVNIELQDVQSVRVLKYDSAKAVLSTLGITLGILVLAFATFIVIFVLTYEG